MIKQSKSNKAQSLVVGVIVALLIFVTLAGLLQFFKVPAEEREVEEVHLSELQEQYENLQELIIRSSQTQVSSNSEITLASRYKEGFILDSPIPKVHLQNPQGYAKITTINKTKSISGNWDLKGPLPKREDNSEISSLSPGSDLGEINSAIVETTIDYNRLDQTSKFYENTVSYTEITAGNSSRVVLDSEQNLIRGDRINLIDERGDFVTSPTSSDDIKVNSRSAGNTVKVELSNSPKISFSTRLSVSQWNDLLEDQSNVDSISRTNTFSYEGYDLNVIEVQLDSGEYKLSVSSVTLGPSENRYPDSIAVELTPNEVNYGNDEQTTVKFRVLDEYLNPVQSASVNFTLNPDQGEIYKLEKEEQFELETQDYPLDLNKTTDFKATTNSKGIGYFIYESNSASGDNEKVTIEIDSIEDDL